MKEDPRLHGIVQMIETALVAVREVCPQNREAEQHLKSAIDALSPDDTGIRPQDLSSANDG